MQYSYEEIRDVVVDILLNRSQIQFEVNQFAGLIDAVQQVFVSRHGHWEPRNIPRGPDLFELTRDVFWDLFRQGAITLGYNNSNPNFPFFRLSYFGKKTLGSDSPWRFHDTSTYLNLAAREIPDLDVKTAVYLEEAVQSFYSDCLLASCVMIGVAAEIEFLRLLDFASSLPKLGGRFTGAQKLFVIRQKISAFLGVIKTLEAYMDRKDIEDLDTNFSSIQSVLRIARNEAGHAKADLPHRENVYVYLQLFIPFGRQAFRLRKALEGLEISSLAEDA